MLLGQKISDRVAEIRNLPKGIDQRSACRHPDWTGPDDLEIKIHELRISTLLVHQLFLNMESNQHDQEQLNLKPSTAPAMNMQPCGLQLLEDHEVVNLEEKFVNELRTQ